MRANFRALRLSVSFVAVLRAAGCTTFHYEYTKQPPPRAKPKLNIKMGVARCEDKTASEFEERRKRRLWGVGTGVHGFDFLPSTVWACPRCNAPAGLRSWST